MHWLLLLIIVVELLRGLMDFGTEGIGYSAGTMAILLVVILFHELSHCWMAVRLGGTADEILLWPLGGLAYVGHGGSPRDEIRVAGVGPLSNFFLGAACALALRLTGAPWSWSYLNPFESWYPFGLGLGHWFLLHALRLNLILGLFNLCVPAYPLDGGRILFAFLTLRHGRLRAAEISSTVGTIIGIVLVVWGLLQNTLLLAFIGFWVVFESYQLKQLIRWGELDAHPLASGVSEFDFSSPEGEPARRPGWFARWRARRAKRRMEREARAEEDFQQRVDQILEKVGREGMQSLAPEERRVLDEASRRARKE